MVIISVYNQNLGIENGKGLSRENAKVINNDLFNLGLYNIICLQEVGQRLIFNNVPKKYKQILNTNNKVKKGKQLRIYYDKSILNIIRIYEIKDLRIQIVFFKIIKNEINFVFINAHIPQLLDSKNRHLYFIKSIINKFNEIGLEIILCGDFNSSDINIINNIIQNANTTNKKTTKGNKEIDYILYSNNIKIHEPLKIKTEYIYKQYETINVNHYGLQIKFKFSNIRNPTKGINDICKYISNLEETEKLINQEKLKRRDEIGREELFKIVEEVYKSKNENKEFILKQLFHDLFFDSYNRQRCSYATLNNFYKGKTKKSKICIEVLFEYIHNNNNKL